MCYLDDLVEGFSEWNFNVIRTDDGRVKIIAHMKPAATNKPVMCLIEDALGSDAIDIGGTEVTGSRIAVYGGDVENAARIMHRALIDLYKRIAPENVRCPDCGSADFVRKYTDDVGDHHVCHIVCLKHPRRIGVGEGHRALHAYALAIYEFVNGTGGGIGLAAWTDLDDFAQEFPCWEIRINGPRGLAWYAQARLRLNLGCDNVQYDMQKELLSPEQRNRTFQFDAIGKTAKEAIDGVAQQIRDLNNGEKNND